jgi:hypothetical protein
LTAIHEGCRSGEFQQKWKRLPVPGMLSRYDTLRKERIKERIRKARQDKDVGPRFGTVG